MMLSLNCLILGQVSEKSFVEDIGETYTDDNGVEIEFSQFTVLNFKEKLFNRLVIKNIARSSDDIDLWKVDGKKVDKEENNIKEFTESDIKEKLGGERMTPRFPLEDYFKAKETDIQDIHVFIVSTSTGTRLPMFYLSIAVTKYQFGLISFFRVKADPSQQGVPQGIISPVK